MKLLWAWLIDNQQKLTRPVFYRYLPWLIFGFIGAFSFYQSLHIFQYKDFYAWTFLFLYVGLGFIILLSSKTRLFLEQVDIRLALPVIVLLAVGIRIYFIYHLPTQPIYDYATYQLTALGVSQGNLESLTLLEGKPWGYPLLLGLIYKLAGVNILWAQLLNVCLSAVSLGLLYLMANRLVGKGNALLITILYALLPSQIFMNNVVNSEILFIALLLAGLYFSIRFMQELSWKSLAWTGLFLGLAQAVRPVAMIYLLTFFGFLVLQLGQQRLIRLAKYGVILLLGFYLALVPFLALKSVIYQQLILWERGTFGMVFVMGTNVDSGGYWNQEDYDHIKSLFVKYDNNAEKVNKEAFKLAIWRLHRSEDFKKMIPDKINNMWAIDTFGFEWANNGPLNQPIVTDQEQLRTYRGLSQLFYAFVVFFILAGLMGARVEKDAGFRYFTLLFLAFVFLHIFIEVQGRYHMHLTPIFLMLLGYGLFYRDQKYHQGALNVGYSDREET